MSIGTEKAQMIAKRLQCNSVVWNKQGRKNLYLTDEKRIALDGVYRVVGIKSMGEFIGFILEIVSMRRFELYRLPDWRLRDTQKRHIEFALEEITGARSIPYSRTYFYMW